MWRFIKSLSQLNLLPAAVIGGSVKLVISIPFMYFLSPLPYLALSAVFFLYGHRSLSVSHIFHKNIIQRLSRLSSAPQSSYMYTL